MQNLFRKISLFLIIVFVLSLKCYAISAGSYALIETSSGRVLKGQSTDKRFPMASTTKIMTGLLACESGKLDTIVTVTKDALKVEGSSMGLLPDEKISLRDIVYGLLLESGNDAANAIAYYLDGSIPKFAERMNARAAELGLKNTSFENPSGLDGQMHYTTATDLARLGAAAMQNEEFKKIASTYSKRVTYNGAKDGRLLCNHNEMLKLYKGCIGIKTGYTKKSGRCLVTCAERDGLMLVAATLNCHDDWNGHTELLNFGFENLKKLSLFMEYPELSVNIIGGDRESIRCGYVRDISAYLTAEELKKVNMKVYFPRFLYAPVTVGQKIGWITFEMDGNIIAETDIIAEEPSDRERPDKFKMFWKSILH